MSQIAASPACSFEVVDLPAHSAGTPYHVWEYPQGEVWTQFFRTSAGYLLKFPGKADFEILGAGTQVKCFPTGADLRTCHQLFIGQVQPLALFEQGYLVLHASAVEINGVAAVFVGDSGFGKSTMAAFLVNRGGKMLTDDGLVVKPGASGYEVVSGHPSVRLWSDSQTYLFPDGVPPNLHVEQLPYSEKMRVNCGDGLAFNAQPCPVRHVYFLGDPSADSGDEVCLESVNGVELTAELTRHAFILDSKDQGRMVELLAQVTDFSALGCFSRIHYRREFSKLDNVASVIERMCK